jgi:phosphoenolpyruvate phosphomutase
MNLIILAAGKGTRIFNYIGKHKCLININNKTLISKIIDDAIASNIKKISVVVGYKSNILKKYIKKNHKSIKIIRNKEYSKTEMLHSAMLALKNSNDDVIISYSDIYYDKKILNKIFSFKSKNITIPIKLDWKKVWKIRKKNIKKDAEYLDFDRKNFLLSIGEKIVKKYPKGQYMGLIFIPRHMIKKIFRIYKNYRIKNLQISNYLNFLISLNIKIKVIKLKNYWYEFDDIKDFKNFNIK